MTSTATDTPSTTTAADLDLFRDQTRRLIAREFAPERERWLEQGRVDREAWAKAGEAGLLCASMPVEYGGAGGDFRHEAIIAEELVKA